MAKAPTKPAGLTHPRKANEEAQAKAQQELIDARALAAKYRVVITALDTTETILEKVEEAKKSGVIAEGEAPPEISKPRLGDKSLKAATKAEETVDKKITSESELAELQKSKKLHGFGGWKIDVQGVEVDAKSPDGRFGFIPGAFAWVRVTALIVMALFGMSSQNAFANAAMSDKGQLGDSWSVQDDGDIVPYENGQDVGSSAEPVDKVYANEVNNAGSTFIQTSLLAEGSYAPAGVGATITLNSSSTGLGGSSVPYKLIIKNIGGAGVDLTPGSILPNGLPGQTLRILISGVGSGTCQWLLTPTTKTGYTSITFTASKQWATLNYDATLGWVIGGTTATINL